MVLDIAAYIVGVHTGRLDKIHLDGWIWMTTAYFNGDVHTGIIGKIVPDRVPQVIFNQ